LALRPSGTHDQILAVVKTAAALSWGLCFVTGHSPCLRGQYKHMYIIVIIISIIIIIIIIILGLQSRFCTTDYAYCSHNAHGYIHSLDN
jgi:uncharacterized membrane protein